MVKFLYKYNYLCKYPYNTSVVYTNYRPLVHFLGSDLYEGIYGY